MWGVDGHTHLPWPPHRNETSSIATTNTGGDSSSGYNNYGESLEGRQHRREQFAGVTLGVQLGDNLNSLTDNTGACSFTEPLYTAVLREKIHNYFDWMKSNRPQLQHDFFALDYDEIRGIGRDSRSLNSGLTDGELLGQSMDDLAAIVREASPGQNTRTVFWDDMINPYHDERQDQWYGRQDGTTPCGDSVQGPLCGMFSTGLQNVTDTSIVFMNWFYGAGDTVAINTTVALERSLGFDVIGCPEYDLTNIIDWVRAIKEPNSPPPVANPATAKQQKQQLKHRGKGLGVIDTDWGRTFGGLIPTASRAWNQANKTVME
jgi:hypothetical protein